MRFAKHTPKTLGWSSSYGPGDWVQLFNKVPGKVQGKNGIQQALTKRNKKKKHRKLGFLSAILEWLLLKESVITPLPFQKTLRRFTHTYIWVNVPRIMSSQWWWGRGFKAVCFWKRAYFCQSVITADMSQHGKINTTLKTGLSPAPESVNKITCRLTKKEWKRRGLRQLCQTGWKSINYPKRLDREHVKISLNGRNTI